MQTIQFPSLNGESQCLARIWMPGEEPVAMLQLVHGMAEHTGRYDAFARYLNSCRIAVCGADHAGHGGSVSVPEDRGWLGKPDGAATMCGDLHILRELMQERLPRLPYFLLGHSLGSFVLRQYLTEQAPGIAGAVLSGTGDTPAFSGVGLLAAQLLCTFKGGRHRSPRLDAMAHAGYLKRIPGAPPGSFAWLSRDPEVVRAYEEDEACGFGFTVAAWRDIIRLIRRVNAGHWYHEMPHDLPLLLVWGTDDPVGGFGKGANRVYRRLRAAGAGPVRGIPYQDARHEVLNETNREQAWLDIAEWIQDVKNAGQ